MGYDTQQHICNHGSRTLVYSALIESCFWSENALEPQINHKESNGVREVYTIKAKHLDQRSLNAPVVGLIIWMPMLKNIVRPFDFSQK
ncbi:Uncharacterised protein [Serratia fonticola]|uniref:Uncharacterized protein n=1 Tax=Serratia fonticola TaxID=47917 RepID=A0A4U9TU78_SERFO|nr:Uncharacterised protein [Serratia fonticola]